MLWTGDPHDFTPVHVKDLHQALSLFVLPEQETGHVASHVRSSPFTFMCTSHPRAPQLLNAPNAIAMSIAGLGHDLAPPTQPASGKKKSALGAMMFGNASVQHN